MTVSRYGYPTKAIKIVGRFVTPLSQNSYQIVKVVRGREGYPITVSLLPKMFYKTLDVKVDGAYLQSEEIDADGTHFFMDNKTPASVSFASLDDNHTIKCIYERVGIETITIKYQFYILNKKIKTTYKEDAFTKGVNCLIPLTIPTRFIPKYNVSSIKINGVATTDRVVHKIMDVQSDVVVDVYLVKK